MARTDDGASEPDGVVEVPRGRRDGAWNEGTAGGGRDGGEVRRGLFRLEAIVERPLASILRSMIGPRPPLGSFSSLLSSMSAPRRQGDRVVSERRNKLFVLSTRDIPGTMQWIGRLRGALGGGPM